MQLQSKDPGHGVTEHGRNARVLTELAAAAAAAAKQAAPGHDIWSKLGSGAAARTTLSQKNAAEGPKLMSDKEQQLLQDALDVINRDDDAGDGRDSGFDPDPRSAQWVKR